MNRTHDDDSQISPQMLTLCSPVMPHGITGLERVKNLKIHMFWIVLCPWFDQSEFMPLLILFNSHIGPGFIFESCGSFLIFK
jgi:hypothetical protein